MKKIISLILVLAMCVGLCACGHTHTFGEWTTVTEAGCTTGGTRERVCECGEKETEATAAAGHSFGDAKQIVELTCDQDGQIEKTCTVCGEVETETQTATGHSFKAATAFAPKTCSTCGATEGEALAKIITVGDVVESENHNFTVQKIEFTGALKDKRGNITYNHSSDFCLYIKLDFTNLATEAFERWNSDRASDISLKYMNKYDYEGEVWVPADDIVPLATDSLYVVFEVPDSMSKDATNSILATFTIDGETYAVVVQQGEAVEESGDASAQPTDVSGSLSVGDEKTNGDTFSFVLDSVNFTEKPSMKVGNVTYSFGTAGKYYMTLKLKFTNMDAAAMEDWGSERISDMNLTFNDKYNYEGRMWIPANEIVPLDTGWVYILFEVSKELETSGDSLVAEFTVDGCDFTVNYR